jgi:hypothetical protein
MMHMRRPRQRDQHIHVQQPDAHGWSSNFLTSSSVMGWALAGTWNTGNPLLPRFPTRRVEVKPCRARSDRTRPTVSDFARARLLAAASRSSSIVSVVRINPNIPHPEPDVKMHPHHDAQSFPRDEDLVVSRLTPSQGCYADGKVQEQARANTRKTIQSHIYSRQARNKSIPTELRAYREIRFAIGSLWRSCFRCLRSFPRRRESSIVKAVSLLLDSRLRGNDD